MQRLFAVIQLGRYCLTGARTVITKDVLDYALMVGNPAKHIGWACEGGECLNGKLSCQAYGKEYKKTKEGIEKRPEK